MEREERFNERWGKWTEGGDSGRDGGRWTEGEGMGWGGGGLYAAVSETQKAVSVMEVRCFSRFPCQNPVDDRVEI